MTEFESVPLRETYLIQHSRNLLFAGNFLDPLAQKA